MTFAIPNGFYEDSILGYLLYNTRYVCSRLVVACLGSGGGDDVLSPDCVMAGSPKVTSSSGTPGAKKPDKRRDIGREWRWSLNQYGPDALKRSFQLLYPWPSATGR